MGRYFGSDRTPLSGGNGGVTRSDTLHDTLFIEHKHHKKHSVISLYDETKEMALKEEKIPVVTLSEKGRPGFYIVVHSDDLTAVANQRLKTKKEGGE